MPQDSKRKRYTRRLKRQLSLHKRELEHTYNENQALKQILVEARVREIKAVQAEAAKDSLIKLPSLKEIAAVDQTSQ